MGRADPAELSRWRALDATVTLAALAAHAKRDAAFEPIKNRATSRWHVAISGREFELLLTGSKFFDTRNQKGGGGAVDLAMYLLRTDFRTAIGVLRCIGL